MILSPSEFSIEDDKITISKKELEEWRDNFERYSKKAITLSLYYAGMRDVLIDLIKLFEPLEGE